MTRSLIKGPYVDKKLLETPGLDLRRSENFKVYSRNSLILPQFINRNFEIHNGKGFIRLSVTEEMVGHKFGEFASTRKKNVYKKKLKKKKK
uniref:Small ribosomal subunit protein uS19c n=1 Tax=Cymbomonas tetramitiformis TaxID=36881 RepID=A0A1S5R1Z5_9CHLO|nr:ribosomal protein S19 [Cymbomonas tetramitiformis]ANA57096.1 ribosomal protein S19 [Cymbomonas tetramitiformis]